MVEQQQQSHTACAKYTNDQINISSCCEHRGTSIGKAGRRVQERGFLSASGYQHWKSGHESPGETSGQESGQERPGAARTCQERPGARVVVSIGVPALEERPGESRSDERPGEQPGQELPGAARSGQERPGARAARSVQKRPGAARAARSGQELPEAAKINENQ